MKDKKRLNVLFSRAKNGLYVVGKKKCIDSLKISNGKFLKKFQSEYLRFRRQLTAPTDCAWYQPGQVDVRDAEDEDFEPIETTEEEEEEEKEGKKEKAPIEVSGSSFPVFKAKKFEKESCRLDIASFLEINDWEGQMLGAKPKEE
jgi:hypothetical protein